ncbi:MAG: hypothetical protein JWO79_3137 [Actinomycetia bacterium]|jgi:hypothetical protein|nr:hypothetical protein [Actinomycetes bacterium]
MAEIPVSLGRSAFARVAGLAIGIVALKPDAAAPAARLSISDTETGETQDVTVRPGDRLTVWARTVHIAGIIYGEHAHVDFTVAGTRPGPEETE